MPPWGPAVGRVHSMHVQGTIAREPARHQRNPDSPASLLILSLSLHTCTLVALSFLLQSSTLLKSTSACLSRSSAYPRFEAPPLLPRMSHVEHARRSISPSSTHSDDSRAIYLSTHPHVDVANASSAHTAAVDTSSLVSTKEIGGLGFRPSSTLSTSPAPSGRPFHSSAASISSADDSTQAPCTPRDDNSIVSPRLALAALIESDQADVAVKDNTIQPAAPTVSDDRPESIFTVSAYLVNRCV